MTTTTSPWTVDPATSYANHNLPTASTKKNDAIDMNGFLKLLTAQMQYQDPFSPMDNSQMVAQMAQFSSLAAQTDSNSLLGNISDSLSGSRMSDAASWIGRSMLVKSNIATPDRTGAYAGELTLDGNAENVSVDLVNASGATVKTIELGAQSKGSVPFFWDGTNDAGEPVSSDALQVRVRGATPSLTATWASIAAVQSPAGGTEAKLMTALGNFSPTDALRLG